RECAEPRCDVVFCNYILDLRAACEAGVFDGKALEAAKAASVSSLNAFFALGASARKALRGALMDFLSEGSAQRERLQGMGESLLQPMNRCQMQDRKSTRLNSSHVKI